ncbi:MAG: hypothetical protein ACFFDI_27645 [Promethearchaeota archaeon]
MSVKTPPQTFSQALLNLEKIRKIEDPITFGLIGLHKAKEYPSVKESEKQQIRYYLQRFEEFYDRFKMIVTFEQEKDFDSMERWLTEKSKKDITSRIDTLLGIYSSFSSEGERAEQLNDFKVVAQTVKDALQGNINRSNIDVSLQKLETLRETLAKKIESEKKTSEKIISGRAPSI